MMIRSFADLHPLLRQQYATNKESDRNGAPGAPQTDTGRTAAARSGRHTDQLSPLGRA